MGGRGNDEPAPRGRWRSPPGRSCPRRRGDLGWNKLGVPRSMLRGRRRRRQTAWPGEGADLAQSGPRGCPYAARGNAANFGRPERVGRNERSCPHRSSQGTLHPRQSARQWATMTQDQHRDLRAAFGVSRPAEASSEAAPGASVGLRPRPIAIRDRCQFFCWRQRALRPLVQMRGRVGALVIPYSASGVQIST